MELYRLQLARNTSPLRDLRTSLPVHRKLPEWPPQHSPVLRSSPRNSTDKLEDDRQWNLYEVKFNMLEGPPSCSISAFFHGVPNVSIWAKSSHNLEVFKNVCLTRGSLMHTCRFNSALCASGVEERYLGHARDGRADFNSKSSIAAYTQVLDGR